MRWIVPPHSDFTLRWSAPDGAEVVDLSRAFVERISSEKALGPAGAREGETPRAALMRAVAASVLARSRAMPARLRAIGAALEAVAETSPLRLRIDDLELREGTTESTADLLRVSERPLPFEPELETALESARSDGALHLWIHTDQQLPAAFALARRARVPITLAGPFARLHGPALTRLPLLAEAKLVEARLSPEVDGHGLEWFDRERPAGTPDRPWGGSLFPSALERPEELLRSGLRCGVVRFCRVGSEWVGADGSTIARDRFAVGAERLRAGGVRLVGELWLGAPSITAAELEATVEALPTLPLDSVGGLRFFHWSIDAGPQWAKVAVELGSPAKERDLARSRPFTAPGTLDGATLETMLPRLHAAISARWAPLPGRVAGAFVEAAPVETKGGRIAIAPEAAIVRLPTSMAGEPVESWFAVNLRKGSVLAMDARIAAQLGALRGAASPAEALPLVSEGQRAKLLPALISRSVLVEVP